MYRINDIKTGLLPLIGWRQNYDTGKLRIGESLTSSESGVYFQDFHPLLTLENIQAIAPEFTRIDITHYSSIKNYLIGDLCNSASVNYKAVKNSINQTPLNNPEYWEVWRSFDEWLLDKTGNSIQNAVRALMTEKTLEGTSKNILESKVLFDGSGRISDLVRNTDSLVGFEIVPIRAKGVTLKIEKIGLQFKDNSTIKLYLMHSSSEVPVKTIELTRTQGAGMQWFACDWFLPYMSQNTDAGGSWYVVYDQNDLGENQAIQKSFDWAQGPCSTCSRTEMINYISWSKYLEVHPFKVPQSGEVEMWDISKNIYSYETNYGINLQVTVSCDATDFIIEQRNSFINVIGLQLACDFLREMAYNSNFRINRLNQNFTANQILYEIDGNVEVRGSGLGYKLKQAMKALKIDTSDIDRVCLPCLKNGINVTSI